MRLSPRWDAAPPFTALKSNQRGQLAPLGAPLDDAHLWASKTSCYQLRTACIYWLRVAAQSGKEESSVFWTSAVFVLQNSSGGSERSNVMQMNWLCVNATCVYRRDADGNAGFMSTMWPSLQKQITHFPTCPTTCFPVKQKCGECKYKSSLWVQLKKIHFFLFFFSVKRHLVVWRSTQGLLRLCFFLGN